MPNNKIVSTIEEHPVITSLILGGAGLAIALVFAAKNKSSSSNASNSAASYTCTDAAGNPVDCNTGQSVSGASISPGLSQTDLATMLQDMEQQILNWEQNFQPGNPSSGGTNPPGGNNGGGNNLLQCDVIPVCLNGTHLHPPDATHPCSYCAASASNGGGNTGGGQSTIPWWRKILSGGSGATYNPNATPGIMTDSYYKLPTAESSQQLATFFGLTGATPWAGIAYNPHNKAILSAAYASHGNALIPAGTAVWIPTSLIPD